MTTPDWLRGGRAAVVFLTRIPAGGFPYSTGAWRWSSAWFPLTGAALGVLLAAAWMALVAAGPWVAAIGVLAAGMLLTGAFHEDGLADTADALGGGYTREKVLEILKDSRIGTYGAAALFVSLAWRAALLVRIGGDAAWALVLAQALSRVPPIWLMAALPYVTDDSVARSKLVTRAGWPQAVLASAFGLVVLAAMVAAGFLQLGQALGMSVVLAACAWLCGWRFHARVGGLTGDFLGATQQVCECAILFLCALRHP